MVAITGKQMREEDVANTRANEAKDNKDLVPIIFDKEKTPPQGYKNDGTVYYVDSALADDLCRMSKKATQVARKTLKTITKGGNKKTEE